MRVLFVTGNQNKVTEAFGILSPLGFVVEQLMICLLYTSDAADE